MFASGNSTAGMCALLGVRKKVELFSEFLKFSVHVSNYTLSGANRICILYYTFFRAVDNLRLFASLSLRGLVVRVPGYRSGGPGSILDTTRKKVLDLERGPLSLVITTEKLLDRKIAAPV
jgi:hypothetical protein